jgi:heavy metal efflux system protein
LIAVPFLGAVFLPSLDEGSILVMMYRVPGISVTESLHGNEIIETVLREFPKVATVYSRTGSLEVASGLNDAGRCAPLRSELTICAERHPKSSS